MREIICTVKRSRGSKRRPKVMTAIGRTHPTSGTRHTTNFSLKKKRHECSVLLFYQHKSHLTTVSLLQLALLPRFSLLILNSANARWARWVCSTAAPPHSENVTTGIKMPYTPSVHKYKPFQILFQMEYNIQMYVDIVQSVDSLILLRTQSLVEISRKTNTPYLGIEGVSPYGGNIGSLKYEHVNGRE